MGQLVKGTKWAKEFFAEGSQPTKLKVWRWIDEELIPGKNFGDDPFVDADAYALAIDNTKAQNDDFDELTVDDLLG